MHHGYLLVERDRTGRTVQRVCREKVEEIFSRLEHARQRPEIRSAEVYALCRIAGFVKPAHGNRNRAWIEADENDEETNE